MAVAVLGPGAVGGVLAASLAAAGERVVCVCRPGTAAAVARDGLTVVREDGELHVRPDAVEELAEPVELLVVGVKAMHLEAAVGRVRSEPEVVLPLLNGLEHMETLRARFPRVVAATIGRVEAFRAGPTRIVQRSTPLVVVAGGHAPRALVDAGIETKLGGSEADVLWEKLARQAPIALLTSLTGSPVGEVRDDPRLRPLVEEACAVAAADGASTTFAEQWGIIESLPAGLTTSTARDVAAGRPSELDAIAGAVVRAGRRLGVSTQTFEEILELCRA